MPASRLRLNQLVRQRQTQPHLVQGRRSNSNSRTTIISNNNDNETTTTEATTRRTAANKIAKEAEAMERSRAKLEKNLSTVCINYGLNMNLELETTSQRKNSPREKEGRVNLYTRYGKYIGTKFLK